MKYLWFICITLTACPTLQTRDQVLGEPRQASVESRPAASNPRVQRADRVAEEQSLLEEVRLLNGKIEELSFQIQQLENSRRVDQNRLENMEKRLIAFSETLILIENNRASSVSNAPATRASNDPYERAEQLFARSDWRNAILEYNKYRDNFPKGRHYADATYKIGVCFQELGMNDEARAFYSEVIENFPNSKSAKSAKYRLNQLKK